MENSIMNDITPLQLLERSPSVVVSNKLIELIKLNHYLVTEIENVFHFNYQSQKSLIDIYKNFICRLIANYHTLEDTKDIESFKLFLIEYPARFFGVSYHTLLSYYSSSKYKHIALTLPVPNQDFLDELISDSISAMANLYSVSMGWAIDYSNLATMICSLNENLLLQPPSQLRLNGNNPPINPTLPVETINVDLKVLSGLSALTDVEGVKVNCSHLDGQLLAIYSWVGLSFKEQNFATLENTFNGVKLELEEIFKLVADLPINKIELVHLYGRLYKPFDLVTQKNLINAFPNYVSEEYK